MTRNLFIPVEVVLACVSMDVLGGEVPANTGFPRGTLLHLRYLLSSKDSLIFSPLPTGTKKPYLNIFDRGSGGKSIEN